MDLVAFQHDRGFVLDALCRGEIDYLEPVGEAAEADFFRHLIRRDVLNRLAEHYPTPREKQEVPVWLYLASELTLKLHGAESYHAFPRVVRSLRLLDEEGLFIGDGSYLFVPDHQHYQGSDLLWFDEHNHPVDPEKVDLRDKRYQQHRCYKLVSLIHINRQWNFFFTVAARVVPGRRHECPILYALVDEVLRAVGRHVIQVLILDRGFIDGAQMGRLQQDYRIETILPVRANMDLHADALGLTRRSDLRWEPYVPVPPPPTEAATPKPLRVEKREAKRQQTLARRKAELQPETPGDSADAPDGSRDPFHLRPASGYRRAAPAVQMLPGSYPDALLRFLTGRQSGAVRSTRLHSGPGALGLAPAPGVESERLGAFLATAVADAGSGGRVLSPAVLSADAGRIRSHLAGYRRARPDQAAAKTEPDRERSLFAVGERPVAVAAADRTAIPPAPNSPPLTTAGRGPVLAVTARKVHCTPTPRPGTLLRSCTTTQP
jgi:hypothetical protein